MPDLAPLAHLRDRVATLLADRPLEFPIASRAAFTAQMLASGATIVFNGRPQDVAAGTALLPEFFLPLTSRDDLIDKVTELLMSRGLAPAPALKAHP